MNKNTTTTDQLIETAQAIHDYQERKGLSDAALCREYSALGSTKTYKRILEGDFSELYIERQLDNYSRVLELTRMPRDAGNDKIYDDLAHVRQSSLAVSESYQEKGNDHLVIIEGGTGSGKTTVFDVLERRFDKAVIRTNAHGGWKIGNNPLTIIAADLLEAARLREYTGEEKDNKTENKIVVSDGIPISFADRKKKLFEALNKRKRILLIDEGHEIGPFGLNFLKSIINETPTIIVLAVIPTIFRRLESKSYEDAIQLTGNRLYERVRIPSPAPDQIALFLDRRGIKFTESDRDNCLGKLSELAPLHANWKFVNRFARRARQVKGAVDNEQCIEQVRAIERSRKGA